MKTLHTEIMDTCVDSGFCRSALLHIQPQFTQREKWAALAEKENFLFEPLELSMGPVTDEMLEWYAASGRVNIIHGNFIDVNPASGDMDYRALSQKKCHESCRLAVQLGAKKVVFHSSAFPFLRGAYLDCWAGICADFYAELAVKYGLTVCIENSQDTDPEPLTLLMKKTEGADICACLDIGHANYSRAGLQQWFEMLGSRIGHLHLSDNMGSFDDHFPLGSGNVDWIKAEKLWQKTDCGTSVTLEVGGIAGVEQTMAYLKENNLFGAGYQRRCEHGK